MQAVIIFSARQDAEEYSQHSERYISLLTTWSV